MFHTFQLRATISEIQTETSVVIKDFQYYVNSSSTHVLFLIFKLRLGALIPRSVCLPVCRSVCLSVGPPKITKKLQNFTKHYKMLHNVTKH